MFVRALLPTIFRAGTRNYQVIAAKGVKVLPVYPPVENKVSDVLNKISSKDLSVLDADGSKRQLLSRSNADHVKAGDVVRIIYDSRKCNYSNFVGYVLSVDRKQLIQDSSLLLRNHIDRTAVELRVPIFSPLVEKIYIIRRSDGRRRRNKHYYIRNTRLDVGDLEASMKKRN